MNIIVHLLSWAAVKMRFGTATFKAFGVAEPPWSANNSQRTILQMSFEECMSKFKHPQEHNICVKMKPVSKLKVKTTTIIKRHCDWQFVLEEFVYGVGSVCIPPDLIYLSVHKLISSRLWVVNDANTLNTKRCGARNLCKIKMWKEIPK